MNKKSINILVVGRVNVGKSLFVSKVTKSRIASSDMPGTTVDYIDRSVDIDDTKVNIIDTAGIENVNNIPIHLLKNASCILIFIDALQGITNSDTEIIENIKKLHSDLYLVCNKCDGGQPYHDAYNIKCNFQEIFFISVKSNFGITQMLSKLVYKYKNQKNPAESSSNDQKDQIKACIIGRTNSGKSTLLNAMLKYPRALVSKQSHTTRDPVHARYIAHHTNFLLIDTAGFSRNKNYMPLGKVFIESALKSIEASDVAIVVVDGSEDNIMHQDMMLLHKAIDMGKITFLLINKIDIIQDFNVKKYKRIFKNYCESKILGVSGLRLLNIRSILYNMKVLSELSKVRINTQKLDDFTESIRHTLKRVKGKSNRIFYIRQVDQKPPTFHMATRHPVDNLYRKFIARKIQNEFFAPGISVKIV